MGGAYGKGGVIPIHAEENVYSPPGAVLHGRVDRVADTPDDVATSPTPHQCLGRLGLSQTACDVQRRLSSLVQLVYTGAQLRAQHLGGIQQFSLSLDTQHTRL